jgi:hypothetical protein
MSADALDLLRACDPAHSLTPLDAAARQRLCERITSRPASESRLTPIPRRRPLQVALALVVALAFSCGVAWAAGLLSPLAVFEQNAQQNGKPPGGVWDQTVLRETVRPVSSVEIPQAGAVAFWYGQTKQGGWCGALRLPNGNWLGTGVEAIDSGGTVPGCFPTRIAVNSAETSPVLVTNGFDYQEDDVDTRSSGGQFWRIRYGRVDAPGAVKVVDRNSGEAAPVVAGLFELAIADPHPQSRTDVHLVALAADGSVVADDCPSCGG